MALVNLPGYPRNGTLRFPFIKAFIEPLISAGEHLEGGGGVTLTSHDKYPLSC